ncbi:MAG: acetyl-CoA carboxylase carboxyltransferase subunit alpha [Victivallales bacterium]|nr:acetyl-CoA carboxylase carboxyltransferase subunit alpha [Victivallales bacterium]
MALILPFEEPLQELENKIQNFANYCDCKGLDSKLAHELHDEKLPAVRNKIFQNLSPWEKVQLARHPNRPYPMDLANLIFTDFLELHGDRRFADDRALIGGFAKLDGKPVMLLATQKGRILKEKLECNFGSANPEGYRKAMRLMQLADKAGIPVICLVDTPGAYPGVGAEERHIGEAIAQCIRDSFSLGVPVISVVTGEGGSGGALALCTANRVLILQYAYYSVITPEGCSAILWRSDSEAPRAAAALRLTSTDMLHLHVADAIVPEPPGGAHTDYAATASNLKAVLLEQLRQLSFLSPAAIRNDRYDRFRNIGSFTGGAPDSKTIIRPATEDDIEHIAEFFSPFVAQQKILSRSVEDIRQNLENFRIAVTPDGKLVGIVAIRDFGDGLCELRSLAVSPDYDGQGTGTELVKAALQRAREVHATRVFTLTMRPNLFQRIGFTPVSIMRFPEKVQQDCFLCQKRQQCDEICLFFTL